MVTDGNRIVDCIGWLKGTRDGIYGWLYCLNLCNHDKYGDVRYITENTGNRWDYTVNNRKMAK